MITVFGSCGLDVIANVPRLPVPGETVLGGVFAMSPGGKGANQAMAVKRAGAAVRFVGAVGRDDFADKALAMLKAEGVDVSGTRVTDAATQVASIFVDEKGENVIAVLPGANATVSVADADLALAGLGAGDFVMLQQEITQAATERALDLCRERRITSILNTAPLLDDTPRLAPRASILVANETEFARLCGGRTEPLDGLMRDWARANGQTLIVTLGAEGARAATPTELFSVKALPVVPVDTVGAGDTFCGYLVAGLGAGLDLPTAMRRAATAASLACLKPGAQPAIPLAGEVDRALL
ncbi:MAG TPA: ribokinase [Devosiaceae bacterium]|jgi:ribokinase